MENPPHSSSTLLLTPPPHSSSSFLLTPPPHSSSSFLLTPPPHSSSTKIRVERPLYYYSSIYPFVAFFVLSLSLSANNKQICCRPLFVCFFRVLIGLSFWPRKGLGTRESNNFFLDASSIQKNNYWTLMTSSAENT